MPKVYSGLIFYSKILADSAIDGMLNWLSSWWGVHRICRAPQKYFWILRTSGFTSPECFYDVFPIHHNYQTLQNKVQPDVVSCPRIILRGTKTRLFFKIAQWLHPAVPHSAALCTTSVVHKQHLLAHPTRTFCTWDFCKASRKLVLKISVCTSPLDATWNV